MKSEKARQELDGGSRKVEVDFDGEEFDLPYYAVRVDVAQYAIEIAEQEAEERMREMAIKAHRACCPLNELQCIHRDRDDYSCTYDCRYVMSFIQKLNEE